jgi:predicted nuclease with TOPRIM domain
MTDITNRQILEAVTGLVVSFDKIETRFDTLETRFDGLENRFDKLEGRFDALEGRFDVIEGRFDVIEGRFDVLEGRFDRLENRFDGLESKVDGLFDLYHSLDKRLDFVGAQCSIIDEKLNGIMVTVGRHDREIDHLKLRTSPA